MGWIVQKQQKNYTKNIGKDNKTEGAEKNETEGPGQRGAGQRGQSFSVTFKTK